MNAKPVFSISLFDLERIGPVGIALLLVFLCAGVLFFFLSFTRRHGRSRWPLHALMALGIIAIGVGFVTAAFSVHNLAANPYPVPNANQTYILSLAMIAPFWFGLIGTLLGVLAGIRALIGLIREPGPRF